MSLILRPPWTRQPQWAAGVDWGHPLAQGLVAWLPGNGLFYDATRRASVTLTGNPQFGTYSDGRLGALRAPAWDGTDDEVSFGTFPLLTTFSLLAWWYEPSTPPADGYRAIIRRGDVFGTNANFVFGGRYREVSSEPRFFCFARNSGSLLGGESSPGGNLTQGAWNRIGVSWRNGEQKLYLNGRVVSTFADLLGPGDSSDPLAFGGLGDSNNGTRIATAAFDARVYNRVLSAGEFAADYAGSPYAIFAPRRIWVPVSAAGGGSVTLTAAQGSYSLTGQAAGLRVARTLTAAQGTYSLSGQAASIRTARPLVAGQGSYTLTGQAAALLATRRLVADQGAYALTGQSSALRAARQIAAAQGSYALTGQDATLTYSGAGAKTLLADAGSYSLTGQAAALRVARTLTAEQGAYTYTGQDAALRRLYTLTAGQGAYALTGQPAGILRGLRLPAAQGSYTLSGQAATLTYSGAAGSTISIVQPYITVYFWRRTA